MIHSILLLAPAAQTTIFLIVHIFASCKKHPLAALASTFETDDKSRTKNWGGRCSILICSTVFDSFPTCLLLGETDSGENDAGTCKLFLQDGGSGLLAAIISASSSTDALIPVSSRMLLNTCMLEPKKTLPDSANTVIFGHWVLYICCSMYVRSSGPHMACDRLETRTTPEKLAAVRTKSKIATIIPKPIPAGIQMPRHNG